MINNSVIKIVDSLGFPLDRTQETLMFLESIGCDVDKENIKVNMQKINEIAFKLIKSNTSITIVAHTHGRKFDDVRSERYFFFYNAKGANLTALEVLKDFIIKSEKENEKYKMEIITTKESLNMFRELESSIYKDDISFSESLLGMSESYYEQNNSLQFEANSIEKAITLLIKLESKINSANISYTFYNKLAFHGSVPLRGVTVFINHNNEKDIEPDSKIKNFFYEYEKNKISSNIRSKITESLEIWKNKKRGLSENNRKLVAGNVLSIVNEFKKELELESSIDKNENMQNFQYTEAQNSNWITQSATFLMLSLFGFFMVILFISAKSEGVTFLTSILSEIPLDTYMLFFVMVGITLIAWLLLEPRDNITFSKLIIIVAILLISSFSLSYLSSFISDKDITPVQDNSTNKTNVSDIKPVSSSNNSTKENVIQPKTTNVSG